MTFSSNEIADSKLCGLSRVTGTLFLEIHFPVEFVQCDFSMLWGTQTEYHSLVLGNTRNLRNGHLQTWAHKMKLFVCHINSGDNNKLITRL